MHFYLSKYFARSSRKGPENTLLRQRLSRQAAEKACQNPFGSASLPWGCAGERTTQRASPRTDARGQPLHSRTLGSPAPLRHGHRGLWAPPRRERVNGQSAKALRQLVTSAETRVGPIRTHGVVATAWSGQRLRLRHAMPGARCSTWNNRTEHGPSSYSN